jgi:hypothetical protein
MPGKKYRSIKWPRVYEALKKKMGKSKAAAISNDMYNERKKGKRGKKK